MSTSPNSTFQFPKKEQAIVLNVISDLKLTDYVVAVGEIIQPKNILFASRIANNRICIYLSSKDLVDQIVTEHPNIKIQDYETGVRRFISPAKRIILSNVCPTIPHSVLENIIKRLGYKTVSPMNFLRASIQNETYSHVLSFRRQIFVEPTDEIELPSSTLIKYEETEYRIFFTLGDQTCFKCRKAGHIASECTINVETNTTVESSVDNAQSESSFHLSPFNKTTVNNKRQIESNQSSPEDELEIPNLVNNPIEETRVQDLAGTSKKKIKTCDSTESLTGVPELLEPVKELFDLPDSSFPIDFESLVKFMEEAVGQSDILTVAFAYTRNIDGLLEMLYKVYPKLTHKSIKNRVVKVQRKLKKSYDLYQAWSGGEPNLEFF